MTDKLTDAEIKKALSNMTYGSHYCAKCKYDNGKGEDRCGLKGCKIARYALALINRLEGEIEKNENIIRVADKTIETFKAENSNLQEKNSNLTSDLSSLKAEVADNIERAFSKTESQIPNIEVVEKTVQICRNAIRKVLNELVGDGEDHE